MSYVVKKNVSNDFGRLVLKKAIKEVKIIPLKEKRIQLSHKASSSVKATADKEKAAETLNIEAIVGKKS